MRTLTDLDRRRIACDIARDQLRIARKRIFTKYWPGHTDQRIAYHAELDSALAAFNAEYRAAIAAHPQTW